MKKLLTLVILGMVLGIGEVAAQTTITTTTIATDTTWTLTGSPYIVTGDVYVSNRSPQRHSDAEKKIKIYLRDA